MLCMEKQDMNLGHLRAAATNHIVSRTSVPSELIPGPLPMIPYWLLLRVVTPRRIVLGLSAWYSPRVLYMTRRKPDGSRDLAPPLRCRQQDEVRSRLSHNIG
ncbi:hypothetical protein VTH06DRAFT_3624 [Thermothelomyces fergusii]